MELEDALENIILRKKNDSSRLSALADYTRDQFELHGPPNVQGGSSGELKVGRFARDKDWDVAYDFAGKKRLLVSLKSIWKNFSGTVPNRIDDLMG